LDRFAVIAAVATAAAISALLVRAAMRRELFFRTMFAVAVLAGVMASSLGRAVPLL
jgi:hypothetical protein